MLLIATNAKDDPAAIVGSTPKKIIKQGTSMTPPPAPTKIPYIPVPIPKNKYGTASIIYSTITSLKSNPELSHKESL